MRIFQEISMVADVLALLFFMGSVAAGGQPAPAAEVPRPAYVLPAPPTPIDSDAASGLGELPPPDLNVGVPALGGPSSEVVKARPAKAGTPTVTVKAGPPSPAKPLVRKRRFDMNDYEKLYPGTSLAILYGPRVPMPGSYVEQRLIAEETRRVKKLQADRAKAIKERDKQVAAGLPVTVEVPPDPNAVSVSTGSRDFRRTRSRTFEKSKVTTKEKDKFKDTGKPRDGIFGG